MPSQPDHLLLRRYVAARECGDAKAARRLWEELAVNNFDRVQQIVKTFRFSPGGPGIPEHERGSAASEAYIRVVAMGANFRSREAGRYYAALVTCVQNSCRDFGRKELRHEKQSAGSVDKTYEPGGDAGPFDAALAAYDAELRERSVDAVEEELERLEAEHLVGWAINQVSNDNYREVLQMTYQQQIPAEEIAERLGISMDNVYARRSRGLKEVETILRDSRS